MPVTLDQFVRDQLAAQHLTVKEFARRSGLGLSHVYQILRGERPRAEGRTFDAIAKGLSMTPAEMAVAMGRGPVTADPDEVEWVALIRQVPIEKRSAARDMLLGLAVQPINKGAFSRRASEPSTPRSGGRRQHDAHTRPGEDSADQGGLSTVSHAVKAVLAYALSPFQRPIERTVFWPAAQPATVAPA